MQKLTEMSNEQLWELFPIVLMQHSPKWSQWFKEEARNLEECLGQSRILRLSHIGSTAVPGLLAKPTVDMLLEISGEVQEKALIQALEADGYLYTPQPEKPAPHMMFMKGYTLGGFAERVYHLHVRYLGDWDELYFRDYLQAHEEAAEQYAALKRQLQQKLEHDRDGYTQAKGAFVGRVTQLARAEFADRYRPAAK